MDNLKKIRVDLPTALLEEVEGFINENGSNKEEFIRNAVRNYLKEKKREEIKENLKNGYPEVSDLNRELADEGVEYDSKMMNYYEEILEGLAEHG